MVYFTLMNKVIMELISSLTVKEIGEECNDIVCTSCGKFSRPHGLGQMSGDKIQLVRKCRSCGKLLWYWIDIEAALIPFGDT